LPIPLGEQVHFAQQEGAVVFGQHVGLAGQLELDQRLQRFGVHGRGVVMVQHLQVGGQAQVGQQHEARFVVGGDDARHRHAGMREHFVKLDESEHVFALGRRVHDDQGGAQRGLLILQYIDAEIAAEAGVGRGRAGACHIDHVQGLQPCLELGQACVGRCIGS
jgi:hypothetical protein